MENRLSAMEGSSAFAHKMEVAIDQMQSFGVTIIYKQVSCDHEQAVADPLLV